MDDDIALLRQEIAALAQKTGRTIEMQLLPLVDRIDDDLEDIRTLHDNFVIPAILLMAADGDLKRLQEWLATTAAALHDGEQDQPTQMQLRVAYWRKILDARKPWLGFDPGGWMSPAPDADPPASPD